LFTLSAIFGAPFDCRYHHGYQRSAHFLCRFVIRYKRTELFADSVLEVSVLSTLKISVNYSVQPLLIFLR